MATIEIDFVCPICKKSFWLDCEHSMFAIIGAQDEKIKQLEESLDDALSLIYDLLDIRPIDYCQHETRSRRHQMTRRPWIVRTYCFYEEKTVNVEFMRPYTEGASFRTLRHTNITKASQHRLLMLIRDKPTSYRDRYELPGDYGKEGFLESYIK
jgi:hypothetical protein